MPRTKLGPLAAAQKTFARRRKGSKNKAKAGRRIARLQARQERRRRDAAHRITTTIAKNHGVIVIEDLDVSGMTASAKGTSERPGTNVRQKAGLNRSMLDVAPGEFWRMLEYKALWNGSRMIAVDPRHTSQTCSACGVKDAASRVARSRFVCTSCGTEADADVNAAKNILDRGLDSEPGVSRGWPADRAA